MLKVFRFSCLSRSKSDNCASTFFSQRKFFNVSNNVELLLLVVQKHQKNCFKPKGINKSYHFYFINVINYFILLMLFIIFLRNAYLITQSLEAPILPKKRFKFQKNLRAKSLLSTRTLLLVLVFKIFFF